MSICIGIHRRFPVVFLLPLYVLLYFSTKKLGYLLNQINRLYFYRGESMSIFKPSKQLFGNNIEPACTYCQFGNPASDEQMILCSKKGVVSPYYSCNKFLYCPTKRIPKRMPKLPDFSPEEFKL